MISVLTTARGPRYVRWIAERHLCARHHVMFLDCIDRAIGKAMEAYPSEPFVEPHTFPIPFLITF